MTVIANERSLVVRNLAALPHGTGARYLEVIESHIPGEYIAKQWRRKLPAKPAPSAIFVDLQPSKE